MPRFATPKTRGLDRSSAFTLAGRLLAADGRHVVVRGAMAALADARLGRGAAGHWLAGAAGLVRVLAADGRALAGLLAGVLAGVAKRGVGVRCRDRHLVARLMVGRRALVLARARGPHDPEGHAERDDQHDQDDRYRIAHAARVPEPEDRQSRRGFRGSPPRQAHGYG